MTILALAEAYMATTKPSVRKQQGIKDMVDAIIKIRHYEDMRIRNKKVAENRAK